METNVEPSTSGKEVINKQSYVVTMNDPSELMPTSESQPEQPRTQTVIKKTKSQKKGKAKIDVKAVTGMEQEGSQEEETQEQGDAFTLELDEDPLGSSGLFMAEDTSETMETEASTSATPASTKRKGKPKKLSSAKVCACVRVCVLYMYCGLSQRVQSHRASLFSNVVCLLGNFATVDMCKTVDSLVLGAAAGHNV